MKQTTTEAQKTQDFAKYSVLQNIRYCLQSTITCHAPLLCWCLLKIAIGVLMPILTAFLPKVVMEMVTAQQSAPALAAVIALFMGSLALLSSADVFLTKFIYHQKFRMNTFYLKRLALKGLRTDYIHQEDGHFRQLQTESFSCCNGNYSPLSGIYETLIRLLTSLLGLSVFSAMLLQVHWGMLLFLIGTTSISYFLNKRILAWTAAHHPERIAYQQQLDYINRISGDIRSAKDIRLYKMARWFSDCYRENMHGLGDWYKRLTRKLFGDAVCESGLSLLRESVSYLYLLALIWQGRITVAEFVMYLTVVTGFSTWLSDIFAQLSTLHQTNQKINAFRACLEYPEVFQRGDGHPLPSADAPKEIVLRHVCYRYEGAKEDTLHDVSLTITPGEHLAIVGLNGAGKTTLVKLICGLIDPTSGEVLYDGVDIRQYNRVAFYQLFSAVFQQFSILPVTLAEIVAEDVSEHIDTQRVLQCLTFAGLWDKVQTLPDGIHSQFGKTIYDDGLEFSGGEVQKLLLARAMYKHAPVMLLDEPTAALDPIAESTLYENYHHISAQKTTVFVSHRLASTSFCTRILLLENGRIREEGSHQTLLAQDGQYRALFDMQAKYYRKGASDKEVSP